MENFIVETIKTNWISNEIIETIVDSGDLRGLWKISKCTDDS
jgi:hypothetical protein